jgi:hypothetical protein
MNTKVLKALVDLADGEVDCVDVDAFFNQFPKNAATLRDLRTLKQSGYISLLTGDDEVLDIGVNKKALGYFK